MRICTGSIKLSHLTDDDVIGIAVITITHCSMAVNETLPWI